MDELSKQLYFSTLDLMKSCTICEKTVQELKNKCNKNNKTVSQHPTQKTISKQNPKAFKSVDHIIAKMKPYKGCKGEGTKIIPFLTRIVKEEQLKHVCMFGGKLLNSDKLRASMAIRFAGNSLNPNPKIYVPNNFQEEIDKCPEPIIVISFGLLKVLGDLGHSNLIIIDKNLKEYERFEPHGQMEVYDDSMIEQLTKTTMAKYLPSDYKYISPMDYCLQIGPQVKAKGMTDCKDGGFCAAWSTLYGHLRIMNPDFSRSAIIDKMLKMAEEPFFIPKYVTYINTVLSRN